MSLLQVDDGGDQGHVPAVNPDARAAGAQWGEGSSR